MPIFTINNFRLARYAAKMTQAEAAEKIGVNPLTIIQWEKGTNLPSKKNVEKIAEVYGVPVDVLLDNTPG